MINPNFQDIPQFTKTSIYQCHVSWKYLERQLEDFSEYGLNLDPDFQRAHVWTPKQQKEYIEYVLRGGNTGNDIYFNCQNWQTIDKLGEFVLVDGKQRLEAVRKFMGNKLTAFGYYFKKYEGYLDIGKARFNFHVNDLKERKQVLQWYLEMNTTGTPHTKSEIDKVKNMLKKEKGE